MAESELPEAGWGLPGSLRALYLGLFAVLMLSGSGLVCWYQLYRRDNDGPVETFIAAAEGIGLMSLASAGLSASLIELGRSTMVVAHYLDQWLKKRQEERLARAVAAAVDAAVAEAVAAAVAEARAEAESQGLEQGREQGLEQGLEQGREQGLEQGRGQGIAQANSRWEEWNGRRLAAEAAGRPFDEPPPSLHPNGHEG